MVATHQLDSGELRLLLARAMRISPDDVRSPSNRPNLELFKQLVASQTLPDVNPHEIAAWWGDEREEHERLAGFLVRRKIFRAGAEKTFEMMRKGYLGGGTDQLFLPEGAERLRSLLAEWSQQSVSKSVSRPETPSLDQEHEDATGPPTSSLRRSSRETVAWVQGDQGTERNQDWHGAHSGSSVGQFKLLERLGGTASTTVYLAEDALTHRSVAVKVFASGLFVDPAMVQRFTQHCRLAAKLAHGNCLRVLAAGQQNGIIYLAMPLMEQGSVEQMLENGGPLPLVDAVRIMQAAANGLAAAHKTGMVHGNLRPANILLGSRREIRLADIGLATHLLQQSTLRNPDEHRHADLAMLVWTFQRLLTGTEMAGMEEQLAERWRRGELKIDLSIFPIRCRKFLEQCITQQAGEPVDAALFARWMEALEQEMRSPQKVIRSVETSASETQATQPPTAHGSTVSASSQPVEIGSMLGKCMITERVGQGGFATIFRAVHRTLNIPVAIKLLDAARLAEAPELLEKFTAEARILAQVAHPNIVRVLDFEDDPIRPYLVLEFVEGLSLAELVRHSGRMRLDRVIDVLRDVTYGLMAAHRLGVVHRDITPANILLTREGSAKVTDFGLAAFADAANEPEDAVWGTAAYMSPEQAERRPVDFRGDIYSLGITFYHAVTGQLPFSGANCVELMVKHLTEEAVAPHVIVPELPGSVSTVILKMIAKSPADRHTSYQNLLDDLNALRMATLTETRSRHGNSSTRVWNPWKTWISRIHGAGSNDQRRMRKDRPDDQDQESGKKI